MYSKFKEVYPRFDELVSFSLELVSKNDAINDIINWPDGQLAIQTNDISATNWRSGIGKSEEKTPEWEHQFSHIQPELINTVLDDYLKWLDIPVYRTRIMISRPKTCYSIHRDYSPRLHLPLITNKQCNFVFTEPARLIHMPATGETFWLDTKKSHTFMNGSLEPRLHLVMIVKD